MKTTLQIRNQHKIHARLQRICSVKNWVLVQSKEGSKWLIYMSGELVFTIVAEIAEDIIITHFFTSLIPDMAKSAEIFLRSVLSEKDVRDTVKPCTLKLLGESVCLSKSLRFAAGTKDNSIVLLNTIDEMLSIRDNACTYIQDKMDYLLFIKLN